MIKSYTDRGRHVKKNDVTEYLQVEDLEGKAVRLEYDARVHKPLKIDELLSHVGEQGLRTMPIGQLVTAVPKEHVFPKRKYAKGEQFCAVFENSGPLSEDDNRRKEVIEHTEDEAETEGFKYCCLDLKTLQDRQIWVRGGRQQYYELDDDIEAIRKVMRAVDNHAALGRWAQFKRSKRDTWLYVNGGTI